MSSLVRPRTGPTYQPPDAAAGVDGAGVAPSAVPHHSTPTSGTAPQWADPRECAECAARLHGAFCHVCGQRQPDSDDLTLRRFVRAGVEEVSGVDARLVRTLGTLARHPGRLTREYVAGHRRRWVSPLQLFLLLSAAFVLSGGWRAFIDPATARAQLRTMATPRAQPRAPAGPAAATDARARTPDRPPALDADAARHAARSASLPPTISEAALDQTYARYLDYMDWAKLPLVAVPAAIVWWMQRRRVRGGLPHLVFALHYQAFTYLVGLVVLPVWLVVPRLTGAALTSWMVLAFYPVSIAYLYRALRTAYGEPRRRAARLAIGIFALEALATGAISMVLMLLAVRLTTR